MAMTMNEIYEEILKNGGMTPSKKIKDTSIRFPNKILVSECERRYSTSDDGFVG